jgi:hypothetical protein
MKYVRFVALTAVALLAAVPPAVNAQTIFDAARLSAIQERCSVLQTSLDQLQRRDLVARTDHGHEYENLTRQINALSQRLRHNKLPTQTLDKPADDFKSAVAAFRQAYVSYDDSITILRQIDCQERVTDFARLLEETRVLRAKLGVEVTRGEEALKQYRKTLVELQTTLPAEATE